MVLDRRERHGLVQALLRAHNRKYGGNLLENVAQSGTASGDGSYGEPVFGGARFFSSSQSGVTTGDQVASQSYKLIPTPRSHPFLDSARFSYTGEVVDTAKAGGFPAFKEAPRTLPRLVNPQTIYDPPLAVYAANSTEHKPTGGYLLGKTLDLNKHPATNATRAHPVALATQLESG
ncbi:hypothetical protein [Taklimakanibacter deserti]|uniref:hypothetical protein n=1 Tax=Taklimakanibacter deserti TaxID=2267839 RepID=UPI0013C3F76E